MSDAIQVGHGTAPVPESGGAGGDTASRAGDSLSKVIRAHAWTEGLTLRTEEGAGRLADAIEARFLGPLRAERDRLDRELDTALARIAVLETGRMAAAGEDTC